MFSDLFQKIVAVIVGISSSLGLPFFNPPVVNDELSKPVTEQAQIISPSNTQFTQSNVSQIPQVTKSASNSPAKIFKNSNNQPEIKPSIISQAPVSLSDEQLVRDTLNAIQEELQMLKQDRANRDAAAKAVEEARLKEELLKIEQERVAKELALKEERKKLIGQIDEVIKKLSSFGVGISYSPKLDLNQLKSFLDDLNNRYDQLVTAKQACDGKGIYWYWSNQQCQFDYNKQQQDQIFWNRFPNSQESAGWGA